jgi:hypothetical protein
MQLASNPGLLISYDETPQNDLRQTPADDLHHAPMSYATPQKGYTTPQNELYAPPTVYKKEKKYRSR